jgi:hypothetical protein
MELKHDLSESFFCSSQFAVPTGLGGSLGQGLAQAREKIYPLRLLNCFWAVHIPHTLSAQFGRTNYFHKCGQSSAKGASKRQGKELCHTVIETHRQCQGHIGPHHSLELGDES